MFILQNITQEKAWHMVQHLTLKPYLIKMYSYVQLEVLVPVLNCWSRLYAMLDIFLVSFGKV